ncbi:MAG TPA: ribosomal protein S18-alanine N-acetyltransferase [Chloroflexota bacterium]
MIEPMQLEDIPAVMKVEKESFSMPWPANAYKRELKENRLARYIVARRTGPPLQGDAPPTTDKDAGPPPALSLTDRILRYFGGNQGQSTDESDIWSRRIVGYAGLWLMVDEAHITAIAVAPPYRGFGIGEMLMLGMIDISRDIGAQYLTLEVRVSNDLAQNLYRKYGFKETGVRRKYYSDNNEDAMIMWSDPLESREFREMVEHHRSVLLARLRSSTTQAALRARAIQV